jgi:CheY-like chemotaxis protein
LAALVLAFPELPAARDFHQRYQLERQTATGHEALAVMLCSRANMGAAYELCRSNSISDYVLFWPVTHDPLRLPLAVHRACDAFESLPRAVTPAATAILAAPAGTDAVTAPPGLHVLVVEDHDFQLAVALSVLISAGLRATGAAGAQAALALTVSREREMVMEALRDGAADFIVKPFDRDTLLQKIRRVAAPAAP